MILLRKPIGLILKKWQKPPFNGCQFKTTLTQTVDETTTTWNSVDIGAEHPNRIIILAMFLGVSVNATSQVHGVGNNTRSRSAEAQVNTHKVPTGTSVTITVSAVGSLRKAVGVYVAYPKDITRNPGSGSGNTNTPATNTPIIAIKNGFLVYAGSQVITLGTFTTTSNGTDAVTEDVDAQIESASSYTFGHINFTESHSNRTLTLTQSTSGTKQLASITMGEAF